MSYKNKIRINQEAGKSINVSCAIFRKILFILNLISQFRELDYLIITKQKIEPPHNGKL